METILNTALLSVFLTGYYTPLVPIQKYIIDKIVRFIVKYNLLWLQSLVTILTCAKCLAFTLCLILTLNLYSAIISSILALFIKYLIEYVTNEEM
jgi:hypothetical protein